MDGIMENNKMKKYTISLLSRIEQLHDEIIDRIEVIDNNLVLCLDELHLVNKFTKCKIIFSEFEDIFSDVSFTFLNIHKNKIRSGRKIYLDEFIEYSKKRNFFIEICDIYEGYERIFIVGKIVNCKISYGNYVQLCIDTKSVTYEFC
jgi:hypothetical protein